MAKKIKFPLEMDNGVMVRTLEELKENFSLEKTLGHFASGKLLTWLNDRYYEEEAMAVEKLNSSNPNFKKKLCEVFDVEYTEEIEIDMETLEQRNMRINKLKQFTEDESIIQNINSVAFDQEELADLLDENVNTIYICGDTFTIPLSKENINYIGINNPIIAIKSKTLVDFSSKNIFLSNVRYNKEYQEIIDISTKNDNTEVDFSKLSYKTSKLCDFMMKKSDREASSKLFDIICRELSAINYDIDKTTKSTFEIIKDANLVQVFDRYLNRIS